MRQEEIFHAIANRTSEESKAIELLFSLYYPDAKRIAYRSGLALDEIQSIFQDSIIEVFIRISQKSFILMGEDSFKRFILKVVKNKCLSEARKKNKYRNQLPVSIESEESSVYSDGFKLELIEKILQVAGERTQKGKEIIYRRFYLKQDYSQIAEALNYTSPLSVKNQLYRTLEIIRKEITFDDFLES